MKKVLLIVCFLVLEKAIVHAQYSLTLTSYSQNFDGLGTGNATVAGGNLNLVNASLNGWFFAEAGSSSNTEIIAGTGSASAGDTYNFGLAANANRKLGGLQSGSLEPTIGFYFTNNTAITITDLTITYTGETWRVGAANRTDRLDFQYSTDATSLTTGSWTDFDLLDYANPGQATGNGSIQHSSSITNTITGLNIAIGATFFIRWTDFNATGSDDGMSIEDFSFTASYVPPSTAYFRSIQTGSWNTISTWESSPTGLPGTWVSATATPTSAANIIQIRNLHTVTINSTVTANQVVIENGGVLDYTAGTFTVDDGPGDDVDILTGGVFTLSLAATIPTFSSGTATLNVSTGGILRIAAASVTITANAGVHIANIIYQDQSILEYTLSGGFGSNGVTYFPNVNATTIPIFRITNSSPTNMIVGANANTIFNGVFENNGTALIVWQNSGDKIFRNGISGNGNISANASAATAKFIINGSTAELGGSGSLIVPTTGGLEIGSALNNTTVTLTTNKTVTGNISLLSTNNTYVDPGANHLTVSGNITGGSETSYIRTAGTGALILNAVGTFKDFPVGHSKYNPVRIENVSNHDWTVNVNDGVTDLMLPVVQQSLLYWLPGILHLQHQPTSKWCSYHFSV